MLNGVLILVSSHVPCKQTSYIVATILHNAIEDMVCIISFITVKHDCVFGNDFSLDEISYVSKV